jgi:hypothetical protein
MSDPSYPADVRKFDHDPRSPFHHDPSDGLDEMTRDELTALLANLEEAAEDPDCPRNVRHDAERRIPYVKAAIAALPYEEDEEEDCD